MTTRFGLLPRTALGTQFAALAFAVLSTLATLSSIHTLADTDATTAAAQMARADSSSGHADRG